MSQSFERNLKTVGRKEIVVIQEADILARRFSKAMIPRCRRSTVLLFEETESSVLRKVNDKTPVIDDNHLEVVDGLIERRTDRFFEEPRAVVSGYDDAEHRHLLLELPR
jgi:hypothetical protein